MRSHLDALLWICGPLLLLGGGCARSVVCGPNQAAPLASPATRLPGVGHHHRAHAHNDYEHPHPLADALAERFYSVEADIWYDGGRLKVAHSAWEDKGTLKDLYLDPLQALVSARGSVQGDGVPFVLWVDLKENHPDLPRILNELLSAYPMLTRYSDTQAIEGAVTVVLTGNREAKAAVTAGPGTRWATRDSNDFSLNAPPADPAWGYYALDWRTYIGWNGEGTAGDEDRRRLGCIMENARALGRRVRFWGAPERPEVWSLALEYGVDFINTDKLAELNAFLEQAP